MTIFHMKEGIVSGMILGDGYLRKRQPCLRIVHTLPQLNYLKFKINLADQLGYSARLYRQTTEKTNLGPSIRCTGTITGLDITTYYGQDLSSLLNNLNPLGLLIWWLDDGHLAVHTKANRSVSRFGYLNTQGYGLDGNQLISQMLFRKFGIESTIHVDSKSGLAKQDHYRIYINATNFRRLIDFVREFIPWIPTSMRYKLNMQYVVNRNSNSLYLATHYNF